MPSTVTLGNVDYGAEKSNFGLRIPTVTAANFDASITNVDSLQAAIDAVLLQATSRRVVKVEDVPYGGSAASQSAQRETKWRVIFTDDVDPIGNGSFELPCADLTLLNPGSGEMNTSAGAGAALVAELELNMVSRLGNAISVSKIIHVGRNL